MGYTAILQNSATSTSYYGHRNLIISIAKEFADVKLLSFLMKQPDNCYAATCAGVERTAVQGTIIRLYLIN
jgi:hypothetical protein